MRKGRIRCIRKGKTGEEKKELILVGGRSDNKEHSFPARGVVYG